MQQKPSQLISGHSRSRLLFLLSGETSTLPVAEARALVHAHDPTADLTRLEDRIVLARTVANPGPIAARIAFARRVGEEIPDGSLTDDQLRLLDGSSYRLRMFRITERKEDFREIASEFVKQTRAKVDLENPRFEVTVICGSKNYFLLTRPSLMRQDWVSRRPRSRAYFHPAAIFPKLSRALVNLSEVGEGETLLDPYVGTGSILIEGSIIGAVCAGIDINRKMIRGAIANQRKLGLEWSGVVRADSLRLPVTSIDAIVTDIPYGRASSREGTAVSSHLQSVVANAGSALRIGGKLVVMHPKQLPIAPPANLDLEEEHQLYIHRRLTRTISVLRRTRM